MLALLASLTVPSGNAATLSGTFAPLLPETQIDLTAEGATDWTHWGLDWDTTTFFDRKAGVIPQISNFTLVGGAAIRHDPTSPIAYSWSDGTPLLAVSDTTATVYVTGAMNGFRISAPADTLLRTLNVYVGASAAQGRFEAALSDSSASIYTDFTLDNEFDSTNGVYTLNYAAASTGQVLIVTYTVNTMHDSDLGSISLQAASLVLIGTNKPPLVTLTAPVEDSNFNPSDTVVISADASDVDGAIAAVEFYDGRLKVGEATTAPYSVVWNNLSLGWHRLTALARDDFGATTISAPVEVIVTTTGGALSGTSDTPPMEVNLTTEGRTDWAHWGLITENSFDHKAGVSPQISNYAVLGSEPAYPYADNVNGHTWTDGTPTLSASSTPTGVYVVGTGNGFEITAPADTTIKTIQVYLGTYAARGKLEAFLSDFSASLYLDSSVDNPGNGPGGVYSLQYQAASAGQTITVRYTVSEMHDSYGNVTLQAATLVSDNQPPFAVITNPVDQATFYGPTNITIEADASDSDGSISKVEFFRGATRLGESTARPYRLTWTNVPPGSYVLTAKATDNRGATFISAPVNVYVIIAGGILLGRIATPPPAINLTEEGDLGWAHWGLLTRNSFDHKIGGFPIANVTTIGGRSRQRYADNASTFAWTDGTPTLSVASTRSGIFVPGLGDGFQLVLPADRMLRRLKLYVGLYGAKSKLEASLSDFSAPPYSDSSLSGIFDNVTGVYTIYYAAASAGQTLKIQYTAALLYDTQYGNVTWQSATLVNAQPRITVRPGLPGDPFSFLVSSEPGFHYRCQIAESLISPIWEPMADFIGDGTDVIVTDNSALPGSRFYRVKLDF